MSGSSTAKGPNGLSSGLAVQLHPLPLLNVSDHFTRARLTSGSSPSIIGALLGTQSNREVSVVNSFELLLVQAGEGSSQGQETTSMLDMDVLQTRRDQFTQVFPTLDVIGWYTTGQGTTPDHIRIHRQLSSVVENPILLLYTTMVPGSQDLPVKVYEATPADAEVTGDGTFVELGYGIETGEAERIAVDGVSRGDIGGGNNGGAFGSLTTQRNAIRMLHERALVLNKYLGETSNPDPAIIRQINALVSTLPSMDAETFVEELAMEHEDVSLTGYLTSLTEQLSELSNYSDKHNALFPYRSDDFGDSTSKGGRFRGSRR